MDNGIISILQVLAVFLPLVYAIYLLVARFRLTFVDKKVLNWGNSVVNLFSFLTFLFTYLFCDKASSLKYYFDFYATEKFSLGFGLIISEYNLKFLIFTSFLCFLLSLYSKLYFDKKKQFIFTKQRFYSFISLSSFLIYLFVASINLFQSVVVMFLQSVIVFVFSYFDIFKSPTNYNITRFNRITLVGNFSFLLASLILLKYAILSHGYINSTSLDFDEFNVLVSYMYGISSEFEFIVMTACFIVAIFTRLSIFPFSCYYSFFANS